MEIIYIVLMVLAITYVVYEAMNSLLGLLNRAFGYKAYQDKVSQAIAIAMRDSLIPVNVIFLTIIIFVVGATQMIDFRAGRKNPFFLPDGKYSYYVELSNASSSVLAPALINKTAGEYTLLKVYNAFEKDEERNCPIYLDRTETFNAKDNVQMRLTDIPTSFYAKDEDNPYTKRGQGVMFALVAITLWVYGTALRKYYYYSEEQLTSKYVLRAPRSFKKLRGKLPYYTPEARTFTDYHINIHD